MTKLIGMIGFGLISKVHTKILFQKKNYVDVVLVKTEKSINDVKFFFNNEFSYIPKITSNYDQFFKEKIKFLFLCSPPQTHFFYLIKALDRGISVFCEKPLFWENQISYEEIEKRILKIKNHKRLSFLVNTSNSLFADEILKFNKIKKIKFFKFIFHTNGSNKFSDIGVDLLPHGLSILIRVLGYGKISNLERNISEFLVKYKFLYDSAEIEFEFMQGDKIEKRMTIHLNDLVYKRVQTGFGSSYKVHFITEGGEKIENIEDPFHTYVDFFLDGFRQHKIDLFNLELMCEILKGKTC